MAIPTKFLLPLKNGFPDIGRASGRDKKKSANRMTFIQLALSSLVTPEGF